MTTPALLQAQSITICTDRNYWYPYTYEEQNIAKGMHVDIVAKALSRLGYQPIFTPLPWKRCLQSIEVGLYNAILSASYKPERARYIHYPPDGGISKQSEWRVMQVEYVVVVSRRDPYEFDGNPATLPRPVMVPLGYSIADDLRELGIEAKTDPSTIRIMKELMQTQKGVVITPPMNAKALMDDPIISGSLRINHLPFTSKSYFLGFSKTKSNLNLPEMKRIWDEIAAVRNDQAFMAQLFQRYAVKADPNDEP